MTKYWAISQITATKAEILIYGYIGNEVMAANFVSDLAVLSKSNSQIDIRINSGGGDVFQGIAIFNAIRNNPVQINAYIDGMAASMASVIAIACKKVFMSDKAMFMTHSPKADINGTAEEMRKSAVLLDEIENIMAGIYAERTGLTLEEAKEKYLNNGDRWINAGQALIEKIIDGIYDNPKLAATPTNFINTKNVHSFYYAALAKAPEYNKQSVDINELINQAKKDKNITSDQVESLKKAYEGKPDELMTILKEFAKMRIDHLMSLSWEQLDKSDLGTELANKYRLGYEYKRYEHFGKSKSKNQFDYLFEWAVDKCGWDEDSKEFIKGCCEKYTDGSVEALRQRIKQYHERRLEELRGEDWNKLDVEWLKENYYELFKQKYKEHFGIDYKEKNKSN